MPQRRSSIATRRASWRSGVTRAAVRPGVSSAARIRSASASASPGTSGWSSTASPRIASGAGGARDCQAPTVALGRSASDRKRARASGVPSTSGAGQVATALRSVARASSSCFRPYCGWLASSSRQLASSRSRSSPGSTTVPRGRRAITWSSARVAGMLPVEPAATIRAAGGAVRQRSASAVSRRWRRSAGSRAPLCGQHLRPDLGDDRQHPAALLPMLRKRIGDEAIEGRERHPLGLQLVEQRGQLGREAQRVLDRPAERSQETRQEQLPPQGADRRRQRQLEGAVEEQFVSVDLADRLDPRQQEGVAARRAAGRPRPGCGMPGASAAEPARRRALRDHRRPPPAGRRRARRRTATRREWSRRP